MKTGTVCISIQEYNQLHDFKKTIEDGKAIIRWIQWENQVITNDKAVEKMAQEIQLLRSKLNTVNEEWIKRFQDRTNTIRKLSVRQFRKWRKDPENVTYEK
ncbi:MAG: hypothetical protein PHX80_04385 [Candidatus Nanoarchaeia archaeon]|nr:hypothetical protein [Candidatus Nanoarchaeia archaeon]MDD5551253.1 hypothetical protein [Candidatus Omnitrophota bacterium]